MLEPNPARQKLLSGQPVTMAFLCLGSPAAAQVMALSGIDILAIDGEHMPLRESDVQAIALAVHACGKCCLLRTAVKDPKTLMHYMDLGIDGICATQTETAEEAAAVIRAVKFPPDGARGLCDYNCVGAFGFLGGRTAADLMACCNQNTLVFVTLESQRALDNLEGIAALAGIDGIHIGPGDLSADLGLGGDPTAEALAPVMRQARRRILAAGKATGGFATTPESIAAARERGDKIILVGADITLLRSAAGRLALSAGEQLPSVY